MVYYWTELGACGGYYDSSEPYNLLEFFLLPIEHRCFMSYLSTSNSQYREVVVKVAQNRVVRLFTFSLVASTYSSCWAVFEPWTVTVDFIRAAATRLLNALDNMWIGFGVRFYNHIAGKPKLVVIIASRVESLGVGQWERFFTNREACILFTSLWIVVGYCFWQWTIRYQYFILSPAMRWMAFMSSTSLKSKLHPHLRIGNTVRVYRNPLDHVGQKTYSQPHWLDKLFDIPTDMVKGSANAWLLR